jgi:hypothetical protein
MHCTLARAGRAFRGVVTRNGHAIASTAERFTDRNAAVRAAEALALTL